MADDIRCTTCGTINPAGAQFCKSCQASLTAQSDDSALPDWLGSLPAEDQAAPAQPGDLPDWLTQLGGAPSDEPGGSAPFVEPQAEASGAGAAVPDWLAEITPTAGGDSNLPDWMEDLGVTPPPAEEAAEQPPAADQPDWLERVRARQQADQAAETSWAEETSDSEGAAAPAESLPDWLGSLGQAGAAPSEGEEAGAQPFSQAFDLSEQQPAAPAGEESMPDWLSRLGEAASQPAAGSTPAFTPAFSSEEDLAEFILDTEAGGEAPIAPAEPAEPAELPEWVSQLSPEQELPELAKPPEAEAPPELTPAQLPSWLEAMRPVESAAPTISFRDEKDTYVESAGPLAGLRGVLPAEAEVARQRKPPAYSVKLQVSEAQQAHLAMLDALLKAEGQPKPIASPGTVSALPLLRIVIALVLTLAVFWTLWVDLDTVEMPAPDKAPAEVGDVVNWVNALPPNAPVLLAFDYEPALSGEMDAAAKIVIEDMMGKQAHFAVVSTSPTGPMVAEHLFGLIAETQQVTYPHRTNLGYLPGGATGLLGFAANPRRAVPASLSAPHAWQAPPLDAVRSMADFAMLVVLTDSPDTARNWIEQVRPWLGQDKPLVMVISAQAEPLVRPYYQTSPKQVNGMVVSLMGSSAYESRRGLLGLTRAYWDSFSAVLLATLLLVLIGGLINLLLAWLAERKQAGAA